MSTDNKDYRPAMAFINGLFSHIGLSAKAVSVRDVDGQSVFLLEGDLDRLDQKPGLTSAITVLLGQVMNRLEFERGPISLDLGGRFDARQQLLQQAADDAARAVAKNGRRAVFEQLSSSERRVVHQRLADHEEIRTFSEGREGMRLLMVEAGPKTSN